MEFLEVQAFKVVAEGDDRGGEKFIGYYTEEETANAAAFKAGWWDSDGQVIPVKLMKSPGGNYYSFTDETKYVNVPVDLESKIDSVIKKLSSAELEFLKKNLREL